MALSVPCGRRAYLSAMSKECPMRDCLCALALLLIVSLCDWLKLEMHDA